MKRTQKTVNPTDPTVVVKYEQKIGSFEVEIGCFFDSITSHLFYKGKEVLFTSEFIHPILNRIAVWLYNKEEEKYQEVRSDDEQYPEFCWFCGESDLRSSPGYVGEEIVYCPCGQILYEEDPMSYIL